jgi:predicted  nucleic acid-binding Zn-ribbon protein
METGASSFSFVGLLWIPLFIGLILGGLYLTARYLRQKAAQEAKPLPQEIRLVESHHKRLAGVLQSFSPGDPEPYGSQAGTLKDRLDGLNARFEVIREEYFAIRERLPQKSANPIEAIFVAPFSLAGLRKDIARVQNELDAHQAALSATVQLEGQLSRISWQVALDARQAQEFESHLQGRLSRIQDRKVRGPKLESALEGEQGLQAGLGKIPALFMRGSEAEVLAQADKGAVIQAYQALSQIHSQQERLNQQLQAWERSIASLQEHTDRLRKDLSSADRALANMSPAVNMASFVAERDKLETGYQAYQAGVSRPELDKIDTYPVQAEQLSRSIHDLDLQLRQVRYQLTTLEQAIPELTQGIKLASEQFSGLGAVKKHPILWTRTNSAMMRLNQQIKVIGPLDKQRTPEEIDQDVTRANQLLIEQKELLAYLQQIAEQHTELLTLLEGPELERSSLWVQSTQKQVQTLRSYHPDNWLRIDGIDTLPDELEEIADAMGRLAPGSLSEAIPEEQLPQRLEDTRRLARSYQAMRLRVGKIESRLASVQQMENQASELLEAQARLLGQVAYIVRSNPYLSGIAAKEIERMQSQATRLKSDLDQRLEGTVESKSRQVSTLAVRSESSMHQWLEQLNQDSDVKYKGMMASLTRLDAIAALEDPPVAEARRALEGGNPFAASHYAQPARLKIDEFPAEFKRRSEYNQVCTAAQRGLEDIEKPVVDSYNASGQQRQFVLDEMGEIDVWLRQTSAWPPTSVHIDNERKELGRLEESWNLLKSQRIKGIDLVARLGELSGKYQSLADKLRQAAERAGREKNQVADLERELNEYAQLWEKHLQTYQDNPQAQEEIRELLTGVDEELYRLHTEYRERKLDYPQIFPAIQQIHRKVRLYQAALDEAHVIDVNGRVITSRESKRTAGEW